MNTDYKIITTWGRYQCSKEARLYKASRWLISTNWRQVDMIRANPAFVRRKVNEWSDGYRVPTANIIDKTT